MPTEETPVETVVEETPAPEVVTAPEEVVTEAPVAPEVVTAPVVEAAPETPAGVQEHLIVLNGRTF